MLSKLYNKWLGSHLNLLFNQILHFGKLLALPSNYRPNRNTLAYLISKLVPTKKSFKTLKEVINFIKLPFSATDEEAK
jgi:hypothetical protein